MQINKKILIKEINQYLNLSLFFPRIRSTNTRNYLIWKKIN